MRPSSAPPPPLFNTEEYTAHFPALPTRMPLPSVEAVVVQPSVVVEQVFVRPTVEVEQVAVQPIVEVAQVVVQPIVPIVEASVHQPILTGLVADSFLQEGQPSLEASVLQPISPGLVANSFLQETSVVSQDPLTSHLKRSRSRSVTSVDPSSRVKYYHSESDTDKEAVDAPTVTANSVSDGSIKQSFASALVRQVSEGNNEEVYSFGAEPTSETSSEFFFDEDAKSVANADSSSL